MIDRSNLVPVIDVLASARERQYRARHMASGSLEERRRAQDKADAFVTGVLFAIEAIYEPEVVEVIKFQARQRLA